MNRNYNLTNNFNEHIKDEAPKWMDDLFNRKVEKKENPFKDVDNFLNIGIEKKGEK